MDRVCLELELCKSQSITQDSAGNWVLWAEASNENLDFQGQVVLRDALRKSEDYFLQNGVISYDHRHLHADPEDPTWNPEKYIIGEPLCVKSRGTRTWVKFKLYKSSPLAQELIAKIADGSTRVKTSIAGKMPQIVKEFSQKLGRTVEVVKGVLWDELALTFKPVNQTLAPITPAQFVKSLSATPMPTDPVARTGGSALIAQGPKKKKKKTLPVEGNNDNVEGEEDDMKKSVSLSKALDGVVAELTKSWKGKTPKAPVPPVDTDDDLEDDEEPEDEEFEDEEPKLKKSVEDYVREEGQGEALDISEFLSAVVKGIDARFDTMEKSIKSTAALQKSLAGAAMAQVEFMKSFGDAPAPRAASVTRTPRTFGAPAGDAPAAELTNQQIIAKAQAAVDSGKLDRHTFVKMNLRLAKGIQPTAEDIAFVKSL